MCYDIKNTLFEVTALDEQNTLNNPPEEEKKPTPWEAGDPKLPVVQSGHFEKKRAY